jgi:hypothetical protein
MCKKKPGESGSDSVTRVVPYALLDQSTRSEMSTEYWRHWTSEHTPAEVRVEFHARYGEYPRVVITNVGADKHVWAGPVTKFII